MQSSRSWRHATAQRNGPVQKEAENDKAERANEIVRTLVGIIKKRDIVVATGSKSNLWRDMSLKRAVQNWNVKHVDVVRESKGRR